MYVFRSIYVFGRSLAKDLSELSIEEVAIPITKMNINKLPGLNWIYSNAQENKTGELLAVHDLHLRLFWYVKTRKLQTNHQCTF